MTLCHVIGFGTVIEKLKMETQKERRLQYVTR